MKEVFDFLNALKSNNNRDWFMNHKPDYEQAHETMISFAESLIIEMNKHDQIKPTTGKKSLFRIYRDVRFSKDKTPYKTSWNGRLARDTDKLRGGYYYHLEPGNTFIAGGFWGPNAQDLLHIRKQIQQDSAPLRNVLKEKKFRDYFGKLEGEVVKTAPKGFSKDDPDIDLLKHKSFVLTHYFIDEEAYQKDFVKKISAGFQNMRPFLNYMSEILTTDLNGIPLV